MILYVAGPCTGYPEHNYPAFHAATEALTERGHVVLNPADIDAKCGTTPGEKSWTWYMRKALQMVTEADGVALLPGWHASKGASIEKYIADQLEMPARDLADWLA